MSSLLQFRGSTKGGKVGLQVYLEKEEDVPGLGFKHSRKVDAEPLVKCTKCNGSHSQLYILWRKPVGMCGCWVVFRYNGEEHVPDLSCPFGIDKLPRDAIKLSPEQNSEEWHKE
jgi:hypothetical protein